MTSPTVQNEMRNINASASTAYAKQSKVGDSNLGKDAFLRLMIEQMKSQDPSSPTDNTQMITQTAQFTQIEELQKMNSNLTTMNSYTQLNNVMDRYVELKDPNPSNKTITMGVVSEVRVNGNDVSVVLNGQPDTTYPLSLITKFRDCCSTDPIAKPVKYNPDVKATTTTTSGTSTSETTDTTNKS